MPDRYKKMMTINSHNKIIFLLFICFLCCKSNNAQDTTRRQTIQITSSYKPSLRNSVKINLYATPISPDTSTPRLAYYIPPQNLFYGYQPIALKPLSLQADTSLRFQEHLVLEMENTTWLMYMQITFHQEQKIKKISVRSM
jgi:hypothetical protein